MKGTAKQVIISFCILNRRFRVIKENRIHKASYFFGEKKPLFIYDNDIMILKTQIKYINSKHVQNKITLKHAFACNNKTGMSCCFVKRF